MRNKVLKSPPTTRGPMNKTFTLSSILVVVFLLSNLIPYGLYAAPSDMVAQDELFFAQQELKQAKDILVAKEAEFSKLILEKEALRMGIETVFSEKELLLAKIDGLQRGIIERDQLLPKQIQQSIRPLQSQVSELTRELKVLQFSLDEKNARLSDVQAQKQSIELQMQKIDDEKLVLRESLRAVGQELDKLKTNFTRRVQEETALEHAKTAELEAKLSAEKVANDEKMKKTTLMFEDKVRSLNLQLKAKDDEANAKFLAIKAQLDEKIKMLAADLLNTKNAGTVALKNAEASSKTMIQQLRQELGAREADIERRVAEAKRPYEEKIGQLTAEMAVVKGALTKERGVIKAQ